jgi:hypothetical protein
MHGRPRNTPREVGDPSIRLTSSPNADPSREALKRRAVPRALVCATADLMNSPEDGLPGPLVTEALLATQRIAAQRRSHARQGGQGGLLSQGRTREEARANVLDALRLLLSPEPGERGESESLELTIGS